MHGIDGTNGSTTQLIASAIVMASGLVLMVFKIRADSEPGAIPLALVLLGAGWHVLAWMRGRSRRNR